VRSAANVLLQDSFIFWGVKTYNLVDVSEEHTSSVFKDENYSSYSETSVRSDQTELRHNPEDGTVHSHRRENLKSCLWNVEKSENSTAAT
jgi:hypothetical protein